MQRLGKLLIAALVVAPVLHAQTTAASRPVRRAMTFNDFAAVKNVSDPQLSPSGLRILYAVRTTDLSRNRRSTVTYMSAIDGSGKRRFPDDSTNATEARWSPDGNSIAYVAGGQLWIADASGANKRQLTTVQGGASGPVWSRTGDKIAFVSGVYPSCTDDACNVSRAKADEENPVKARVTDRLMYRHWNAWQDSTRAHLFVVPVNGGAATDITAGAWYDVPPGPFGGSEGYSFSPDGKELAFTAKDAGREDAWSTDVNLYTVPATGGTPRVITASNRGADANPVYSPDGRWIIYSSQQRGGFEADRGRLMAYDRATGTSSELLPNWDASADAYQFTASGDAIYIESADKAQQKIFRITRSGTGFTNTPQVIVATDHNASLSISRDGRTLAWSQDAVERPAEIFVATVSPTVPRRGAVVTSGPRQLTHENDALLAQLALNPAEEFWFKGADGAKVQGLLIKPPNWEPGKKYPVLFLIHGGPQGAWFDQWHSRWNFSMFASPGFAVVAVNPRGSTGYGQRFVDEISRDWGGKVFTDLFNGLDAALAANPWMDSTRMGAAGGSYGGYAVNWIAGHPEANRFKALFTHAGVWNLENMYGATEEIWFPEWEYGGPYWDPKLMESQYRRFSPHMFAGNLHVPHLVATGELDYRVPYYENIALFTALQRLNVPSRLIVFPDEGHWIGKPKNQELWWREVLGWFRTYLKP